MSALIALIAIAALAGASAQRASAATASSCPNEVVREHQGTTFLPSCRAYELVSPAGAVPQYARTGIHLEGAVEGILASNAQAGPYAAALAWYSLYPLPAGTNSGTQFLSRRTAAGWSTEDVTPPMTAVTTSFNPCAPLLSFSPDLSHAALRAGLQTDAPPAREEEGYCGRPSPALVEGEPEGFQNVYLRDNSTGGYQLVNVTPPGVVPNDATFQDASTNFSHVVFSEEAPLTSNAPAGEALYEWVNGQVLLVSVLPGGTPVAAEIVGSSGHFPNRQITLIGGAGHGTAPFIHAVSADGSRVFFTSQGDIYARINAEDPPASLQGAACLEQTTAACTVQLDKSQVAGGAGGGGEFLWANDTGTKVFFSDQAGAQLTADTSAGSGNNLYEYNLTTGTLTDITPVAQAGVLGFSGLGESEGSTYTYFVSTAALAARNPEGATPESGQPNLYLYTEAGSHTELTFIATLSPEDGGTEVRTSDWGPVSGFGFAQLSARVAPDGRYIAFNSVAKPTGYDNTPAQPSDCRRPTKLAQTGACTEIYLYDAVSHALACASCGAGTTAPVGGAEIHIPGAELEGSGVRHLQRNVLDSGQVFFNSSQPLMPLAQNGQSNVYEYAAGQLHLISTGTSAHGSYFAEASPNGENVFFITTEGLVGSDTDKAASIYDARVNGGFAEPPAAAGPCSTARECRPTVESSVLSAAPSSTALTGVGNLHPGSSSKTTHKKPAKRPKRSARLRRALRRCVSRHRHNRRRRRMCKRRARRLSHHHAKASRHRHDGRPGARRHGKSRRRHSNRSRGRR